MRILPTMLATTGLAVVALVGSPTPLVAQTTTYTPLDCYQFGTYEEAQAAFEADQAMPFPTLTYLDDDVDGLICECLYYEEICGLPTSEPPTPAAGLPTTTSAAGPGTPLERLEGLREERRK